MAKKYNLKSFKLVIENGSDTGYVDWEIDSDCSIVALHLFPHHVIFGDQATVQIMYGGNVIDNYAENTHLPLVDTLLNFDRIEPLEIPNGLVIRFNYTAIDTDGRTLVIWVRYKQ